MFVLLKFLTARAQPHQVGTRHTYRLGLGSRFWVNETTQISERYSDNASCHEGKKLADIRSHVPLDD